MQRNTRRYGHQHTPQNVVASICCKKFSIAHRIAIAVLVRVLGIRHGGEAREWVAGEERAVGGIVPAGAEIDQAAGRAVALEFAAEAEGRCGGVVSSLLKECVHKKVIWLKPFFMYYLF